MATAQPQVVIRVKHPTAEMNNVTLLPARAPVRAAELLTADVRQFSVNASGKIICTTEHAYYFKQGLAGDVIIPIGAVSQIADSLQRAGVTVSIIDEPTELKPSDIDAAHFDHVQRRNVARALLDSPMGLVYTSHGLTRDDIYSVITKLYNQHTIQVGVATHLQAKLTARALSKLTGERIGVVPRGHFACHDHDRILVATFGGLSPEDADIVVFDELSEALGNRGYEQGLKQRSWNRFYAIATPGCLSSKRLRLRAKCLVGPTIWPSAEDASTLVRVVSRRGKRDHQIAELATHVDALGLRGYLSEFKLCDLLPLRSDLSYIRRSTTILVESLKGAVRIAELLPDWPICCGLAGDVTGCPPKIRDLIEQRAFDPTGWPSRLIATHVGAMQLQDLDPIVVIRGDAGQDDLLPRGARDLSPRLIIDVAENATAAGRRMTDSRIAKYEALGYTVYYDNN